MISDIITNAKLYMGVHGGIDTAFKFLAHTDLSKLPEGKTEIDGDAVYAMLSHPTTRDTGDEKFEIHRKYIDVQFLVAGEECIYFDHMAHLAEDTPYNAEKDYGLLKGSRRGCVHMAPKTFAIFFPEDAHMPLVSAGKDQQITKLVVKVRV